MRGIIFAAVAVLSGCATKPPNSYADQWVNAPYPATDELRTRECRDLRGAIAHEQGAANAATGATAANPMLVMAVQNESRRRVAMLESRASEIGCYAAFSAPPPAPMAPPWRSIDQCFADCKRLTAQGDAACFTACSN